MSGNGTSPSTGSTSDTSSPITLPTSSSPTSSPNSSPTSTDEPPTSSQPTSSDHPPTTTPGTPTTKAPPTTTLVVTETTGGNQPTADNNGSSSLSPTSSGAASLQSNSQSSSPGGLSTAGKTAIAVVVPVVVVALLVLGGIFLWRRRKQKKNAEEARRKEVEEYNYNPNHDPTLPSLGGSEMAEDQSGYRGWGKATTTSHRKGSTTLSGGVTQLSDSGSNPGGYYASPGSPTPGGFPSDGSGDALMQERSGTLNSETVGALGTGPTAGTQKRSSIHRGPSNASSSYSAGNRSDNSGEQQIPVPNPQDYYTDNAYYQPGPYNEGGFNGGQQPIIRDVSARRNTRIESPSVFPQQGNSGIAQNF